RRRPSGKDRLGGLAMSRSRPARIRSLLALEALEARTLPGFLTAAFYPAGSSPDSVAVGDFNSDGRPDLVVANYYSDTVNVLLGNGQGAFRRPIPSAVGPKPESVAVGDFDNDGDPDLAVATYNSKSVTVLLGQGGGTFGPPTAYATANRPTSVAVGDF